MPEAVRQARAADLSQLVALENACFTGDRLSRSSLLRLLRRPTANLLVAQEAGRIVGYALILYRAGSISARLYSLAVHPDFSRRGFGFELLDAAEADAIARGRTVLRLEVRADNAAAIGLYERRGYRLTKRIEAYYDDGAPALRYQRALDQSGGASLYRTAPFEERLR